MIRKRESIAFYLTISPWIIGFLLFVLGPMLLSLYASFTDWDLLSAPVFNGGRNYTDLLTDETFWQSLKVTGLFTLIYVPLDMIGGLALALLVRPNIRGMRAFRTIFYLPTVFSGVAFVVVWMWMLNPQSGLVNLVLSWFGVEGPRWLLDPRSALWALVLMSFWGWGRSMVIFLGGLSGIPNEIYEAAAIDGANAWQIFRHITAPLARSALFGGAVMTWARALGEFGATIIFAGNFPGRTQTMPLAIYIGLELELSVALTLSAILLATSFLVLFVVKRLLHQQLSAI